MLYTPDLSTEFVNNCCALSPELVPKLLQGDPRLLMQPIAGQRAWYAAKRRWVNVHAQLSPFSYISWVDLVVNEPTQADVWLGESIEDLLYVTQSQREYRIVGTQGLCAAGSECAVLEWPPLHENFELAVAFQNAAGKTSWEVSYSKARGYKRLCL